MAKIVHKLWPIAPGLLLPLFIIWANFFMPDGVRPQNIRLELSFLTAALLGVGIISIMACPKKGHIAHILLCALATATGLWLATTLPFASIIGWSMLLAPWLALWIGCLSPHPPMPWRSLMLMSLVVWFGWAGASLLHLTTATNRWLDPWLYQLDAMLPFPDSRFWAPWLAGLPWLHALCHHVYMLIPYALLLAWWLQQSSTRIPPHPCLITTAAVLAMAGFVGYWIAPASGPIYLLMDSFPHAMPTPDSTITPPPESRFAPRNALPSLHTAWAWLLVVGTWPYGWLLRWVASIFALLTMLATVGLGQHYVMDWIVTLPFFLAILSWRYHRNLWAGIHGILAASWFAILGFFAPTLLENIWILWLLLGMTLAAATLWSITQHARPFQP